MPASVLASPLSGLRASALAPSSSSRRVPDPAPPPPPQEHVEQMAQGFPPLLPFPFPPLLPLAVARRRRSAWVWCRFRSSSASRLAGGTSNSSSGEKEELEEEAAPPALRLFLAGSGTDPCFRTALFLPASPPALFAVVPSPFSGSGAGRGTGTTPGPSPP